MNDSNPRSRWDMWMVQAERFAKRENYIDALGRARLVLSEVERALKETEGKERESLSRFRHRVERRVARIRERFEAWNAKIAARRAKWIENAEEEMSRPLPLGPDERI